MYQAAWGNTVLKNGKIIFWASNLNILGDGCVKFLGVCIIHPNLVGGWTNPSEKYARQNGFIFSK